MSGKIVVRISDADGYIEVQDRGSDASLCVGDNDGRLLRYVAPKPEIGAFLIAAQLLLGNVGDYAEETD